MKKEKIPIEDISIHDVPNVLMVCVCGKCDLPSIQEFQNMNIVLYHIAEEDGEDYLKDDIVPVPIEKLTKQ